MIDKDERLEIVRYQIVMLAQDFFMQRDCFADVYLRPLGYAQKLDTKKLETFVTGC